ncbi:hypothetical protein ACTWQB_01950 [Piscibacillus sp. B03]|uniref:hypothetical protein n=1 Tax=Piscibacillus sp. B03 TaxID=3457430 RepID=UPI003FCEAF71
MKNLQMKMEEVLKKDLNKTQFKVLQVFCENVDSEGNYVTKQKELAEDVGVSSRTIINAIKRLMEYEINGEPIITRKAVQGTVGNPFIYTVNGEVIKALGENESEDNGEDDGEAINFKDLSTAQDIIAYFSSKYHQHYNQSYNASNQDLTTAGKVLYKHSSTDIKTMIDTLISKYDLRWKTDKYPRPTIFNLINWVGNQALDVGREDEQLKIESQKAHAESKAVNRRTLIHFGIHPDTHEHIADYNPTRNSIEQLFEEAKY